MKLYSVAFILFIIIATSSCGGGTKKLQYLRGPIDSTIYATVKYTVPVIQPGDILSITVYSDNPVATAIYNQASVTSAGAAGSTSSTGGSAGYLVDFDGAIHFHSLGILKVKGLTLAQVSDTITKKLTPVLNNPYCNVRFNNFKVTVLGEVKNPNVFSIPSEKITILEILGLAGDLTNYARRDSVMIIRESQNVRKFGWLDVRNTNIFNSEYYYLHQNDIVVVHPNSSKQTGSEEVRLRYIAVGATVISTIAIVISILRN